MSAATQAQAPGARAPGERAGAGGRAGAARTPRREAPPAVRQGQLFTTTTRAACPKCGTRAPLIDSYCFAHMSPETEGLLHCVSPEQLTESSDQ